MCGSSGTYGILISPRKPHKTQICLRERLLCDLLSLSGGGRQISTLCKSLIPLSIAGTQETTGEGGGEWEGDSRACHLNSGLEASKVSSEATHITLVENKPKQRRVVGVSLLCFRIYTYIYIYFLFCSTLLLSRQNIINVAGEYMRNRSVAKSNSLSVKLSGKMFIQGNVNCVRDRQNAIKRRYSIKS